MFFSKDLFAIAYFRDKSMLNVNIFESSSESKRMLHSDGRFSENNNFFSALNLKSLAQLSRVRH